MACSAVKLTQNHLKNKASPGEDRPLVIGYPLIVLSQAVMTILFVVGMTTLGFFITTFFYLFLSICLLAKVRRLKSILVYIAGSGAFCMALYFIFNVFHIFLPKAIFI